jgi:DNA-directed RNA polymerase subunit RPC12/RpoP
MLPSACPGQDKRFWKPDDVRDLACPHCGAKIEFWKDDPRRACPQCGQSVANPRFDMGCAKWCKFAKDCVGVQAAMAAGVAGLPREKLIAEMRKVFGADERRIGHALRVLGFAEEILSAEGGNPLVVMAAAILHDIGIHEAERKHGSAAGPHQEAEGPPIARRILEGLGFDAAAIDPVCRIVANHHSARDIDTPEFRIIWDADWLVNLPEEHRDLDAERLAAFIERVFKTATGRGIARRLFVARG